MQIEPRKFVERRKGPDIWVKCVKWSGIFSWVFVIIIYILMTKAKPQVENFIDRFLNVHLRKTWDSDLLQYIFYLMAALFVICLLTFIINVKRHRRKKDKYNLSIIILGIASIIGVGLYLIYF